MSNGTPVRTFNMQLSPNFKAPLDARTVGSIGDRPTQLYDGLIRYEYDSASFVYAKQVNGEWTWQKLLSLNDINDIKSILYSTPTYTGIYSLDQRLINYNTDWTTRQGDITTIKSLLVDLDAALRQFKSNLTSGNYTNTQTVDARLNSLENGAIGSPVNALIATVNDFNSKLATIQSWVTSDVTYTNAYSIDARLSEIEYQVDPLNTRQQQILDNINTANVDLQTINNAISTLQTTVNGLSTTAASQTSQLSTLRINNDAFIRDLQNQYDELRLWGDELSTLLDTTFHPTMAFYRFTGNLDIYVLSSNSGFNNNAYGPWINEFNGLGVTLFTAGSYWWKMPSNGIYEVVVIFESMSQTVNANGRSRIAVTVQNGASYSTVAEAYGFNEWNGGGYNRRQSSVLIDFTYHVTDYENTSFLTKIIDLNGRVMNWSIKFIRWA